MTAWKGIVGGSYTPAQFIEYMKLVPMGTTAWRPKFIVIHNTEIPTLVQWKATGGNLYIQNLVHYYRDIKGWSGGPHLFVDDRLIWPFTPLTVPGVHSPTWNPISWGIEVVGDYAKEPMDPQTLQNVASAAATLCDKLGMDPTTMRFHKEDPGTTHKGCPGKNLSKPLLIAMVQDKLRKRHEGEHQPGEDRCANQPRV